MTHEDYKEMLIAWALTALDESDARALEAHLQTCSECRLEMDQWQESAALLTLSAPPLEPSAEVRSRILENLRSLSAESQQPSDGRQPNVVALKRSQLDRKPLPGWLAIAAAIGIVALAVSLAVLWQQNIAAKRELAQLKSQTRDAQEELARERELIGILTEPGSRMMELSPTKMAPAAHAMLAYDKSGQAILMAKGLPAAPAGKAYQLWFISGGKPIPGKVFKTSPAGDGTLKDQVPAVALNSAVFAITLEPEGGVTSPTGPIYLHSGS